MKKLSIKLLAFLGLLCLSGFGQARGVSIGLDVMFGGRYDNLRMCVGSPAGVKGGPIADVMLNTRVHFGSGWSAGLKLPVMRPILFAVAFKMLQFEPEFTFEYTHVLTDKSSFIIGPGIGLSLHHGPDYTTTKGDSTADRFPAAGPFISLFSGLGFTASSGRMHGLGVRIFYTPLFSQSRSTGTVLGGALEGRFQLSK